MARGTIYRGSFKMSPINVTWDEKLLTVPIWRRREAGGQPGILNVSTTQGYERKRDVIDTSLKYHR